MDPVMTREWQRARARATTIRTASLKRRFRLLGRLDQPGAQGEHRDLRTPLEERHLAQAELAREVLELGGDRLLVRAHPLGDLVVRRRGQPLAVAQQGPAQLLEDLLL